MRVMVSVLGNPIREMERPSSHSLSLLSSIEKQLHHQLVFAIACCFFISRISNFINIDFVINMCFDNDGLYASSAVLASVSPTSSANATTDHSPC